MKAIEQQSAPRLLRWQAAVKLAAFHGMRLAALGSAQPTWTGITVNLTNMRKDVAKLSKWYGAREVPARRLFHEVGHLLVAPRERRSLPNFGHGWDNLGRCWAERVTTRWTSEREESDACLLGVALEIAMLGEDSGIDTFRSQGWGYRTYNANCVEHAAFNFWRAIARLNEAGLLQGSRANPELLPSSRRRPAGAMS